MPLANRATIGNMSPEYGSTIAVFPIDDTTLNYLRLTGRDEAQIALVQRYAQEQGLWHDDEREAVYSEYLELDLGTVVASIAGPKRPQDRVELTNAKNDFRVALRDYVQADEKGYDEAEAESFPASDAPAYHGSNGAAEPKETGCRRRCRTAVGADPGDARGRQQLHPRPRSGDHRCHHVAARTRRTRR